MNKRRAHKILVQARKAGRTGKEAIGFAYDRLKKEYLKKKRRCKDEPKTSSKMSRRQYRRRNFGRPVSIGDGHIQRRYRDESL